MFQMSLYVDLLRCQTQFLLSLKKQRSGSPTKTTAKKNKERSIFLIFSNRLMDFDGKLRQFSLEFIVVPLEASNSSYLYELLCLRDFTKAFDRSGDFVVWKETSELNIRGVRRHFSKFEPFYFLPRINKVLIKFQVRKWINRFSEKFPKAPFWELLFGKYFTVQT